MNIISQLASELNLTETKVEAAVTLIDEGNTIPFIARYRKEVTGAMDDVALRKLDERLGYLRNLEDRKHDVLLLIDAQGKLTVELKTQIEEATQLQRVEDLYKPYRKRRLTRAQKAREAGLEPLANMIIMQVTTTGSALDAAAPYINVDAGFDTAQKALIGAQDIVAETIAEDPDNVDELRAYTQHTAELIVRATDASEVTPYEPYYDYTEPYRKIPNHRILAIDRGEREEKLKVQLSVDTDEAIARLGAHWPRRQGVFAPVLDAAIADAYKRLMAPSLEREARAKLTVRAQTEAIAVFAKNLEGLLSARPVRGARVLALDPGYRTGCKVAVLDETGKLLDHSVVYPTKPKHDVVGCKRELARLIKKDKVNTIVIGNGTASRETEEVVSDFISEEAPELRYTIVNEAGASVYSASELASKEYPNLDVTVRGAMSLGRRLQDPLAELVKIPPQSIGVGQYQHDLDQTELSRTLGYVVEDVVNRVGVNVNTASASLLSYVSGITPTVANNIVAYREEHGAFTDRAELKQVSKLGPKAFLNAAGFLRITKGSNPLDATSVHPESYAIASELLKRAGVSSSELERGGIPTIERRLGNVAELAAELNCGFLTLMDIIDELKKPGRDPRDDAPEVIFSRAALSIDDLEPGMELKGTVRNVVDFGAFVDVGVHQDGLVHISKLANRFVKHPSDVVRVGDTVTVWVEKVDRDRKKISLTMVKQS
ncbi:MAG: RNA-binding transcriptional accessory protein [Atopobium minutum]|uniref:Competence protein ComEA helix-hairpin-helix repeat region n=1 Tax=Atopobium minutum 10063974 TaxID=997872 RepID=N2BUT1_9ACTN|nr:MULTISPECIES: Tex family protein [Atopobium]EMZ42318.1 competence protein ComEA helix-hairpin-helix repeat region [Atopobium minutum 10063974]ERL13829.1 Tex-like protein N-terminal domain protein [Atopobium sp. BV3Ac4]MBS4874180.1 RNA-binding transcriptional accessory protein [Atopobium minutum]MDU4969929.1 Tex family protein [Atopobium minutum]MDU5357800.1 Tex family protein [Atopobium minutum]